MRFLWKTVDRLAVALRDSLLFLVGRRCVQLGEWPDEGITEAVLGAVTAMGGRALGKKDFGLAFDIDTFYFEVQQRRIRLSVEEYGPVTLWGPKRVVNEVADRVRQQLATTNTRGPEPRQT